jgi:hypothetical protein
MKDLQHIGGIAKKCKFDALISLTSGQMPTKCAGF